MYRRSLLVLLALTDRRTGAVIAGARDDWAYVWPRDASAVAIALASAGYRREARRIVRFLLGLDLEAAARFHNNGTPVDGRGAQGDAAGWVDAAAETVGLRDTVLRWPWRNRPDYQEGDAGNYLGNAIASAAQEIQRDFGTRGMLMREAHDPGSGADSAAAWAVRPFALRSLYPAARRTLLRIAATSGRFGIVPSEYWDGGNDPWTAPTAWTAWSLAALGERRAALRLMGDLRRDATPAGMLPERVDARTGVPTSTTPLAWSHAFAILALRQLWP
jgi:glucoamylase